MSTDKMKKWRGVVALVRDAVEHGSRAVERVQLESAKRPFVVLEHIPAISMPSKVVHVAHDVSVKTVHGIIRGVNAVVGASIDVVLEQVDKADTKMEPDPDPTPARDPDPTHDEAASDQSPQIPESPK